MMEKYKLGNHRFTMPTGWHDVPYKTAIKILSEDITEIQVMSLLSGVPEKELKDSTDFETIYHFIGAFTFLSRMPANVEHPEMPRSLKFGDRLVIFPHVIYNDIFDLGKCSVGQVKDMEEVLKQKTTEITGNERDLTEIELITMMPSIVAIYLQALLDHGYDYEKAMKLIPEVEEKLSFKEVVNMGYFFLKRLTALNDGLQNDLRKPHSIRRRLKRALWSLTQRLVSTLP